MAFSSSGRTQTALAEINITPLVDVVLVLLVIFMLTAPVLQSGIEVAVPKTKTVKEITEQRMVVTINRDSEAPIFKIADYGIVGDVPQLVPAILAELKK